MKKKNYKFDSIIYSANFSGVIASLILKSKGENVLLLNRYGFLGGSITESLNLYQKKLNTESRPSKLLSKILAMISVFQDGILFEEESSIVLNPEIVKYVLQKIVEENQISLLFHIVPYKIEFDDKLINLTILGREGEINLSCEKILDCSTEFSFSPLIDKTSRRFYKSYLNFISLPLMDEGIINNAHRIIKLNDDRLWISLEHSNVNLLNVEEVTHLDVDKYDSILRQNKSRIQIIPAQSNLIFEFRKNDMFNRRISFISDFYESFNTESEILIANKIENFLSNE